MNNKFPTYPNNGPVYLPPEFQNVPDNLYKTENADPNFVKGQTLPDFNIKDYVTRASFEDKTIQAPSLRQNLQPQFPMHQFGANSPQPPLYFVPPPQFGQPPYQQPQQFFPPPPQPPTNVFNIDPAWAPRNLTGTQDLKVIKLIHTLGNVIFDKYDANGSGFLDSKEIYPAIQELYKMQHLPVPSNKEVLAIAKSFDKDKNGLLDRNEFKELVYKAGGFQ